MVSRSLTLIAVLVATLTAGAAEESPDFERDVRPILVKYCVRCHGPEKQESRIRLDNLSTDLINNRPAAENWHEVQNVLQAGEMPPEDEPQLSTSERETLTGWVSTSIKQAIEARRRTSGRVVLRRLNRVEYQNTMTDLLGLDMDYARDLPPDPASRDGFRNDGLSLQMSSLQLEYYLKTARRALDRVIVEGPAPRVFEHEFTSVNVNNWLGGTERSSRLQRKQAFLASMPKDYPEQGEFRVRVHLSAELKPDAGFPILEVFVGYRPDTQILFRSAGVVEITSPEYQIHEFRGRLENHPLPVRGQGKFPGLVVMARNIYDDGSPLPKRTADKKNERYPDEPHLPVITVGKVEFTAPVFDRWPPASHRRLLPESQLRETDEPAYAATILETFMEQAFRRPVESAEVAAMTDFFQIIRPEFPTFEGAIRETLAMVLIRPDFLYLLEPAGDTKRQLGDWERASRLSYFLWSTMPDERLRELASAGQLGDQDVLRGEVERMLDDPRATQFIEQFAEQWLHLDVLDRVAVDRDYYPNFADELKHDMRGESEQFLAELIRRNLPATNLLASDFTMLNERLARHYGIDSVLGQSFRPVALAPEHRRGGLLGHASILLSNSTGSDSHAVRRAVWIRDRLLNDPPAPPPPDVPSLEEADPEFLKLSIRDQLEVHRGTEACASCHRGIDPWGIALENFDAVGLWRDEVRRQVGKKKFETQPVKATDAFADGREISGVDGLRSFLVEQRRDHFARALVTRLLTYALGRRLELNDQESIDELTHRFAADDYRLRNLIIAITASDPFNTK